MIRVCDILYSDNLEKKLIKVAKDVGLDYSPSSDYICKFTIYQPHFSGSAFSIRTMYPYRDDFHAYHVSWYMSPIPQHLKEGSFETDGYFMKNNRELINEDWLDMMHEDLLNIYKRGIPTEKLYMRWKKIHNMDKDFR